jgi:translation initiation factor IF-2
LIDEDNKKMDYALPSQPVKIIGLDQLPEAGQNFVVDISTTFIKDISEKIKQESVIERLKQRYESNNVNNEESDNKCINIILKTDTHGSLEAVSTLLKNINVNKIKLTIIHSAVGEVSETDVQLARASKPPAIIVCFNVFANNNIKKIANNFSIKILNYDIIYKLSEEIEKILKNELEPEYVEEATGIAIVRQI